VPRQPQAIRWIDSHRLVSFVVVLLLLAQMWRAVVSVVDETADTGWLNWVVVAAVVHGCVGVLGVLLRQAAPLALMLGMAFSLTPFITALACYLAGSDPWVLPLGYVVSIGLLGLTLLRAPSPEMP
jgi:heme A synthase